MTMPAMTNPQHEALVDAVARSDVMAPEPAKRGPYKKRERAA